MGRIRDALGAFGAVFRNPNLRRIQLALAGSVLGNWACGIALSVYAYERGGAAAVGYLNLLRWIPAAACGPFIAVLADRFPRRHVMIAADVIRAAALVVITVLFYADAPAGTIYALAIFIALVSTAFRPAQAAILPALAVTPDELTAANVSSSTIESAGLFVGPALGGLLLAVTDAGVVFAFTAGTLLWSALMVSLIRRDVRADEAREAEFAEAASIADEALAGFRAIAGERPLRLLVGLFGAQTFVDGLLNVLVVVLAFSLLDGGAAAVGYLNSAIGVGGLLGALAAMALVGHRRLAGAFGLGMVLWGAPIALVAVWPNAFFAVAMLTVVGIGNTLVDVSGMTLLQRSVVDEVLARAFGVLDSLLIATVALGSAIAPAVVAGLGARGALVATGAVLPILTLVAWRGLSAIDAAAVIPEREVSVLRAIPIFAPLPEATVEGLAKRLASVRAAPGDVIIRQGDLGDRFYMVVQGELEAAVDGRPARTLESGSHFGEIALLRDVPRTATVTALTECELYALEREDFIAAVTGHAASADAAEAVVVARLAPARAAVGSV